MFKPVKFAPIAQERIWGGDKLKAWFHESSTRPIGEYWVLSGHPNGTSVVMNGPLAGKTLLDLTREYPEAYLGQSPQERFPLLIKFLEANADLSVQIHPDDAYAQKHEGDFGKTEAWYVLDCREDATIIYGHTFSNREEYERAVREKRVREYLKHRPIAKDQLILVPAQTLHALLAGTMVIEIQQTSDVTYRVYDWDRVDANGKGRELHVAQAGDVMLYGQQTSPVQAEQTRYPLKQTRGLLHEHLVTCPYFVIEKISLHDQDYSLSLGKKGNPDILIVADGEGVLRFGQEGETLVLRKGDTLLVPATLEEYQLQSQSGLQLLRTYY